MQFSFNALRCFIEDKIIKNWRTTRLSALMATLCDQLKAIMFIKISFSGYILFSLMLINMLTVKAYSEPFSHCPSKAFLFQGKPVAAFGVNLVTGSYSVISDNPGINANINGLGFNEQDRYLYGFNTTDLNMVRLGSDFQAEQLNLSGLPDNTSFYVGDVSKNFYYVYLTGVGFYRVDLTPLAQNKNAPLFAQKITSSAIPRLTDLAFHPNNGYIYAVDNKTGYLYQIHPDTGETFAMGDTGETGTFGAMYFDVNGYFYLSRNQDGNIYRIDLSTLNENTTITELSNLNVAAIKFADGPSSSQNDGARCATAPLIDEDIPSTIDFGDAPESYSTLLADNGARHSIDGMTYLGLKSPDGDYDGYISGISDDSALINDSSFNDEDGVNFVTNFETGLDTMISVYASNPGILNAWFDWNSNGKFDPDAEHNIVNIYLEKGANILSVRVPEQATIGSTWSRFRFSQQADLNFNGGSTSGEVEDHQIMISDANLSYRYYPAQNNWITLAYEDQWPQSDDYDMNDVVMLYRTTEVIRDNKIIRIDITGILQALGGDYHNGFAIALDPIETININRANLRLLHNNIKQKYSGKNGATTYDILEQDNQYAVVVVSQDLWQHVTSICQYHRTETGCQQTQNFNFELSVPLIDAVELNKPVTIYNPFIFATEGLYHGDIFTSAPGRSLEIHLPDHKPTEKFNTDFFNLADDTSNPEVNRFYRSKNNLPWALEITENWSWPAERVPLIQAYPHFKTFTESKGKEKALWYQFDHASPSQLFK